MNYQTERTITTPFKNRSKWNYVWRTFLALTSPIWLPTVFVLLIVSLIVGLVIGFFEGAYNFIRYGEFKSEIVDGL